MATRRLERDLTRYREEVELAGWIASERYARKLRSAAGGDYTTVANAILSEVATRVAEGRRDDAARLIAFAVSTVPGFRASPRHLAAAAARALGRPGGWLLSAARATYLRAMSRQRSR